MKKFFVVCIMVLGLLVGTSVAGLGSGTVAIPEQLNPNHFAIGGGYSYTYMDSAYGSTQVPKGWWTEMTYSFDAFNSGERDMAVFAEIGAHYKNKVTYTTWLTGARFFFPEFTKKVTPYIQGTVGIGNFNTDSRNKFLYGVGGGIMVPVHKNLSLKAFQVDFLHQTGYNSMNEVRVSSGLMVNF